MKLSCVLVAALGLAGLAPGAVALDATSHTLHHAKAARLVQPRRAVKHAVAAGVAKPAALKSKTIRASKAAGNGAASIRRTRLGVRRRRYYERFTASSFATSDIFAGDITAGEDPIVRQAAIDALAGMNGTAVVINPANGRVLAMVNQKLALSPGAEPCSTIKLTVAMAALSEGLVNRDTMVQLPGFRMNMTQALAKSNNLYFEELGRELGFSRVRHYANEFGVGELAGYNIEGEQLGIYPDEALPE